MFLYMYIEKTLSNGLTVILENIPYVKSVSVGIWAGVGSRAEEPGVNGLSHFAEHMLLKGLKSVRQEISPKKRILWAAT